MKKGDSEPEKIILKNKIMLDDNPEVSKECIIKNNLIGREDKHPSRLKDKKSIVFFIEEKKDELLNDVLFKIKQNLTLYNYDQERFKDKISYVYNYGQKYKKSLTEEENIVSIWCVQLLKNMGILKTIQDAYNLQGKFPVCAFHEEEYDKYNQVLAKYKDIKMLRWGF